MARRNTKYDKVAAIADWRTGEFTERQLAAKYRISPATAHTLVAGIEKDLQPLISAQISIKQALAEMPEQETSKFEQIVSEKTKYLDFFNNCALENVKKAMKLQCESQQDFRLRAETIVKGKETVVGKAPDTAIQINNSVRPPDTMGRDELVALASQARKR